jgi:hypothetical protein
MKPGGAGVGEEMFAVTADAGEGAALQLSGKTIFTDFSEYPVVEYASSVDSLSECVTRKVTRIDFDFGELGHGADGTWFWF